MDLLNKYFDPKLLKGLINFNFGAESLFGLLVLVALLLWGLSLGKTKILVSILSGYVGYALVQLLPYSNVVKELAKNVEGFWIDIGSFIAAFLIVFLIFSLSFIKKRFSSSEFSLWQIMLFNILNIGFMASVVFSYLPTEMGTKILGNFYWVFGSPQAVFIWAVLPLIALLAGRSFMK